MIPFPENVQSGALYSTPKHKPIARRLLVKVARFIIVVAVILSTAAAIIFDVTNIVAVAVIVPTVATIVPDFEVHCSCCCCCYYCYWSQKETMERERRESYRKCHLVYCEHANHDDTKIKLKHDHEWQEKGD